MFRIAALAIACLLAVPPVLPARAADAPARTELTLEQAVERVQRASHVRVVKAETLHEGEETLYRLRLLAPDGRVSTVTVHAASGRVD
jgi:uncharacterized membrane protein YkoI